MTDMMWFHLLASFVLCFFLSMMLFAPHEFDDEDSAGGRDARPEQKR